MTWISAEPAPAGTSCQWATCDRPASATEDGWRFCRTHLGEHRAMIREDVAREVREARAARRTGLTLRAAIVRLHEKGLTDVEIADALKVHALTIKGERQKLRLPANTARVLGSLQPCGTHAAFNRHKGRGEDPCVDCKLAERAYQRDRGRVRRRPNAKQRKAAAA